MENKIQAVSFDFWNTLFRDLYGEAYREARFEFFRNTVSPFRELSKEEIAEAFKYSSDICNRAWSEDYRTPAALERIELALKYLDLKISEEALHRLALHSSEVLYDHPPELIEGAAEVIESIAGDYKIALISDTGFAPGRVLREVMRRNNIVDHFDVLTFSDEAGRSKPHHSVFLRTAESLGVQPEEMIHIGDLESTDIAGAKGVGAVAVLFAAALPDVEESAADFIIRSHPELPDILERLR